SRGSRQVRGREPGPRSRRAVPGRLGRLTMPTLTYRDALNQALREEMQRDPNVFLMGEEVGVYQGAYKVSRGLLEEFGPKRVVDTPIAELGFAGIGVGAAMGGLRPVVEFMTWNFALLALDQIVNSAGEMRYNLKGDVPDGEHVVPSGKAEVKRAGSDVTLVCHSKTLTVAQKAADQLAEQNVSAEVLDLRSLRPLDEAAILESVKKTNRAVVIEEGWPHIGIGAQVVDLIQRDAFDDLDAPVQRVTQADVPMPYSMHLERAAKASPEKV